MSLLDQIIESINLSDVDFEPFPHLYINNFFQEDVYLKILNSLPDKRDYIQINKSGSVSKDYADERFVFNITPEKIKIFKENNENVFSDIVEAFISPNFFNSVCSKFKSTIYNRIKNFSKEEIELYGKSNFNFEGRVALVKDYTKYQLGAHTDLTDKFLTFLFYLPKDNSLKEIGTSLYKPKHNEDLLSFSSHYTMEETNNKFTEVKKAEFLPNSVLIFPRTNLSYHGVSSINIGSNERNLLLLNFYLKKIT